MDEEQNDLWLEEESEENAEEIPWAESILSAIKNWKKLWQKNGTLLWKVSWSKTSIL